MSLIVGLYILVKGETFHTVMLPLICGVFCGIPDPMLSMFFFMVQSVEEHEILMSHCAE